MIAYECLFSEMIYDRALGLSIMQYLERSYSKLYFVKQQIKLLSSLDVTIDFQRLHYCYLKRLLAEMNVLIVNS